MNFKGKRSGTFHIFSMGDYPAYKYIEKFIGGVQGFIMGSKDFISSISFKLKNENGNLLSFNGQLITFRLSIRKM